jgi:seryl-tRNA synthetase
VSEENEKDYLLSLDRRVSDHDNKLSLAQRDYTELSHEIKELMNRINNGISPSVNEVRKENAAITLSIAELSHKLELSTMDMKSVVRESADHTRLMIQNFDEHKLRPVETEVAFMKKTFIYGVVGALIVVLGQAGINVIWKRFAGPEKTAITTAIK